MKKLVNVLCAAALGIGIGVACGGSGGPAKGNTTENVTNEGKSNMDPNPCAKDKTDNPCAGKTYGGNKYGGKAYGGTGYAK
jgi:hypothetical protein